MARIFQDVSEFCPNVSFQLDAKGSRPTGAFILLPGPLGGLKGKQGFLLFVVLPMV